MTILDIPCVCILRNKNRSHICQWIGAFSSVDFLINHELHLDKVDPLKFLIHIQHKLLQTTLLNSTSTSHKIIITYTILLDPRSLQWCRKIWFFLPSYNWAHSIPERLVCPNENGKNWKSHPSILMVPLQQNVPPISQGTVLLSNWVVNYSSLTLSSSSSSSS